MTPTPDPSSAIVALYPTAMETETAIMELQHAGFDLTRLSIVGRGYHVDGQVSGYYNTSDRVKYRGKNSEFWSNLWSLLFGSAFLVVPQVGPILVAGPLVGWIVGALDGPGEVVGLSAIGSGLCSLGLPWASVSRYETALRSGKYVVIAHGSVDETAQGRDIIARTTPELLEEHQLPNHPAAAAPSIAAALA